MAPVSWWRTASLMVAVLGAGYRTCRFGRWRSLFWPARSSWPCSRWCWRDGCSGRPDDVPRGDADDRDAGSNLDSDAASERDGLGPGNRRDRLAIFPGPIGCPPRSNALIRALNDRHRPGAGGPDVVRLQQPDGDLCLRRDAGLVAGPELELPPRRRRRQHAAPPAE